MHPNKKKLIISENCTIRDAMNILNDMPLGIVMLIESNQKLVGVVTDGDIRRALLKGFSMESSISKIMNKKPIVIQEGYNKNKALRKFSCNIKQIPVVNSEMEVVNLLLYSELCNIQNNVNNITVRARAPLRISFAGGGTDVDSYIEDNGAVVLSTTINKYCFGTLRKRDDERIIISSRDYGAHIEINNLHSIKYDGNLDLLKAVIRLMQPNFGMELNFQSDVLPGTGLGGSATTASVAAGLLNHVREDKLDEYQLAEIAFQAERVELGIAGGWQDPYASVFGGFNFIEFKSDDVVVHPLKIKEETLNELECSFLLCFTGQTRNSGDIHQRQLKAHISKNKVVTEALEKTSLFAVKMKEALLKGDLLKFGKLLHEAWLVKKQFDKNISNSLIDKLYETGINAGSIGGKVLGAGGGGYILFFCPHLTKPDVANALESIGGAIMDFNFDFIGLQTWMVREYDRC